jgi:hypothetical protein
VYHHQHELKVMRNKFFCLLIHALDKSSQIVVSRVVFPGQPTLAAFIPYLDHALSLNLFPSSGGAQVGPAGRLVAAKHIPEPYFLERSLIEHREQ